MPTIMMIHGMCCDGGHWRLYKNFFENKGYHCLCPSLRFHDRNFTPVPPPQLARTSLLDYAADLEESIRELETPPILIGHSMGGLLAQILAGRGLARALVLLAPAAPHGIFALTPSVIKSFQSVMSRWGFWRKPFRLSFAGALYSVLTRMDEEERREVFASFGWESGRAAAEMGFSFLDRKNRAAWVDPAKVTCPALVIGCGRDRMTPAPVTGKIAARYHAEYREFRDHNHWVLSGPGWQEIARAVDDWLQGTCLRQGSGGQARFCA